MEILKKNFSSLKDVSLILGFFDGIHLGHRKVIESASRIEKRVLVTFSKSPAEYFGQKVEYICSREKSYDSIEALGVDYLVEYDFSQVAKMSAEDYLKMLVDKFSPKTITTGFNHTFGLNKQGTIKYLYENQEKYGYKYVCVPEFKVNNERVCSSTIRELLSNGNLEKANLFLGTDFTLKSTVISGEQLGRKLGFPTANMKYPKDIVRLPYGVYYVRVFGKNALLNWGVKPTIDGQSELLELHILDYSGDLYGKDLEMQIIKRIRDEKKFENLEDLKSQISKDIEECLKL